MAPPNDARRVPGRVCSRRVATSLVPGATRRDPPEHGRDAFPIFLAWHYSLSRAPEPIQGKVWCPRKADIFDTLPTAPRGVGCSLRVGSVEFM